MQAGRPAPFLSLHDAVVRRAGKNILDIDDFELPEGQSIAVLGPNGAGKSTFIKLITREILPLFREEPPVMFRGNPRATLAEVKQILGVVSSTMQDQMTVHLPVIEIVVGGLYGSLGIPLNVKATPEDYERSMRALELLGIADLADRDVMTLSTGQARRVLLARALVHRPSVLILDEPCTGLDPEGMFYVRKSMRALVESGCSIILVTHYPEDIIPEIDRLLLIKEGKVFADASKEELLSSDWMSRLFDVPLSVVCEEGYYSLLTRY